MWQRQNKTLMPFTFGSWLWTIGCLVLLSGCAHEMSLEEAKKVSVSMVDSSFNVPPRRIDDILRSIEQHKSDPSVLQQNIMLAESRPTEKDLKSPGTFYQERAHAAMLLGRTAQAASDLNLASKYVTVWNSQGLSGLPSVLKELAFTQLENGNYSSALETMDKVFDEGAKRGLSIMVGPHEGAAWIYLTVGNYEKANAEVSFVLDKLKDLNRSGKRIKDPPPDFVLEDLYDAEYTILGNWAEAEKHIRKSIEGIKKEKFDDEKKRAIAIFGHRVRLAKNLIQQEKLVEAEVVAREALFGMLAASGSDNFYSAKGINLLADIYLIRGRLKDSETLAQKALNIVNTIGANESAPAVLFSNFAIGKASLLRGDWDGALKHFSGIISMKKDEGNVYLGHYNNDPDIGIALIKAGRPVEAEELLQRKHAALSRKFGADHYETAEAKALAAVAMAAEGRKEEALNILRETYPVLMSDIGSKESAKQEERSFRLKVVTNAYLDLLFESGNGGNVPEELLTEEFRITEAARAGTVQKAIVAQTLRNLAGSNRELEDLIRQYQDLQVQIEVSGGKLSLLLWGGQDANISETIDQLRAKIIALGDASASLLKDIKKRVPSYDKLVNPTLITVDDLKKSLRQGEVLISIYPTDTHSYVWAIPYKGNTVVFKSSLSEKDIERAVAVLRKALDPEPQTLGDIPEFDLATAYKLYEELLKPSEPVWQDASSIVFVTSGSLGQLPLYVLPTAPHKLSSGNSLLFANYRGVPWLINKIALTTAPSLDSFIKIRSTPPGNSSRQPFVGFGDPVFNNSQLAQARQDSAGDNSIKTRGVRITDKGGLDSSRIISSQLSNLNRLPDTAEEIKDVAEILGADPVKDVFLRERASEKTVKTMDLSDRKVIDFATHALIPGDLDGLDQPALALSSPAITQDGEDGLLTMTEILKLKLNADWVILSACNTGAAGGRGREAISGLGRAFFYAGARSILVSMWPVETTSAMKLVTGTFRFHKEDGLSRAEALRKSMLQLIRHEELLDSATGMKVMSYAHPFFWAPFVLVGDGSGKL